MTTARTIRRTRRRRRLPLSPLLRARVPEIRDAHELAERGGLRVRVLIGLGRVVLEPVARRGRDLEVLRHRQPVCPHDVLVDPGALGVDERDVRLLAEVRRGPRGGVADLQVAREDARDGEPLRVVLERELHLVLGGSAAVERPDGAELDELAAGETLV